MTQPPLIDALRRLAGPGPDDRPDADLLARFVTAHDPAAFEALVRRYGGLVWGICRRRLRDAHAAEDAFQTTFLALARHAGAIKKPGTLGAWLHRVAVRCTAAVRTPREPMSALPPDLPAKGPGPDAAIEGRDLERAIDAEIDALPEPFRLAFVLCEIEERSAADAARALGCPVGTVESRLTRARERLRSRLARRGVTVGALTGLGLAAGAVPPAARAAAVALGTGTAPVPVARATLADQAARTPLVKTAVGYGLAGGFVLVGVVGVGGLLWALSRPPAPINPNPVTASPRPAAAAELAVPDPLPARRNRDGYPLPPEAIARVGDSWLRHGAVPEHLAFSEDGKFLATGAPGDPWLRVWDMAARRPRAHLPLVGGEVPLAVALSADGLVLRAVIRAADGVQVREYDTFRSRETVRRAIRGEVDAGAFHPDGRRVAVVGGRELRLIDAATGEQRWWTEADGKQIEVAFAGPGRVAVLSTDADRVRLFHAATGDQLGEIVEPHGRLSSAAFSADGQTMAVWKTGLQRGQDGVQVWDVPTRKLVRTITTPQAPNGPAPSGLAVAPDGSRVAVFATTGSATLWPARATGKGARLVAFAPVAGRFSADGAVLATACSNGVAEVLDGKTGKVHPTGLGDAWVPNPIAFGAGGDRLLLEGYERWIDWPDGGAGAPRLISSGPTPGAWGVSTEGTRHWADLSPDRSVVARCVAVDPDEGEFALELLDAATRARRKSIPLDGLPQLPMFAPNGKTVYAVVNRHIFGWDIETGRQVMKSTEPAGELVYSLRVSPDGRYLASSINFLGVSRNGSIRVWDAATGQPLISAPPVHGSWHVAFSPDGKRFAAVVAVGPGQPAKADREIRVWDLETRHVTATFPGFGGQPAFSPDGRTLAVTRENEVVLLEMATGKVRHTFRHTAVVATALAWRADGRVLAAASPEAPIYLWDVAGDRTGNVPTWNPAAAGEQWLVLTGTDAGSAFRALRQLWAAPKEAADLLRTRVPVGADARLAACACEALELPATAEGKAVLTQWAAGPADAPRTREARESLRRLNAAAQAPPGERGRG
jgi:RNA polymerase sigma factor (sigma-70 family)